MPHAPNQRLSAGKWILILALLACGLIGTGVAFRNSGSDETGQNTTFKLHKVSVFEKGHDNFLRGQMCRCQDKPFSEVKGYPTFVSKVPVFGAVGFGAYSDDTNSGHLYYFALDESRGTGNGYDQLYFDSNRDLDLRNDQALKVQRTPPDHGYKPNFSGIKAVAVFDFLRLNLNTNSTPTSLVEIMPRLLLTGDATNTYRFMFFVRTHFFEGRIKVAGERLDAQLANDYVISRFDFPTSALLLQGERTRSDWWGGDRLSAMHKVNGRFFTFSSTPDGNELTVHPYLGDLGTFEVGSGTRKLTNADFSLTGSLQARDWGVAVGGDLKTGRPVEAVRCQVPVGDYLPEFLTLRFGQLRIQLSQNYHSEGKRQGREGRPNVYGIQIRKERPYALDFSNEPEVMFTSLTNRQRVKAGEEILVAAVLVDPKLDIMIRGLEDTSRKQTKDAEGKALGHERNLSLDPTVIITRTNGEKVAEGVMPFG